MSELLSFWLQAMLNSIVTRAIAGGSVFSILFSCPGAGADLNFCCGRNFCNIQKHQNYIRIQW
jgi:hypothetical protein